VPYDCVNVGTAPNVPPLYVNAPLVNTKLVLGFKVPLVKLKVGPLTVNVVQLAVPATVVVPANNVTAAVVFPLYVSVPEPTTFKINAVYVPVLDNVRLFTFNVDAARVNEVVPKFSVLNQLLEVSVATLAPVVNVKFGAVADVPVAVVLPKLNVLVTAMSATVNPPGPVQLKLVASAICNTVVAAVVCVRWMFPALALPNAIARVLVLLELNIPVVNVTPSANVNVPAVKVYVPVTANELDELNVTVPDVCVNNGVVIVPPLNVNAVAVIKLVVVVIL